MYIIVFLCVSCIVLDTSYHERRSVTPPQPAAPSAETSDIKLPIDRTLYIFYCVLYKRKHTSHIAIHGIQIRG